MKPRKDRKFSRLRSRFPLGALVVIDEGKRSRRFYPPTDWESQSCLAMVVGTWRSYRVSSMDAKTIDSPGADPRARTSKNASGYLLLVAKPDVPLERRVFDQYGTNVITLA